ncbi:MAG TPA: hypothetical protein VM076_17215 [Gemmatimonadaceae bacterium]|nr:hypothetical protein [Gemmatimonadaceae bacterium]
MKRLMTAMVAAIAVAACSGGDDGTDPTPEITLAVAPAAVSIAQGATGTVTATITRTGGFAGDVAIAVEGLPTGVTAASAPSPIGSSATSSVITFTVGAAAVAATTNLTIRATGTGVTAKTAPVALTVTAAATPTYTLAAASPVSVAQGATATSAITITRTGAFAGTVNLTATGLPTGVTAAFNPAAATANTSTLTFTAAANATVGTSTVTVTGTATGQTDKTATIQLTVTAVTAGAYTIAVTPATASIVQGATATENIALTRTGGFAGAVTFAVTGLPTGVTAAIAPNNTTTDASVITLTAAANATVGGPTTVTVTGTATGQPDKTATFALTVTAAPVGGFTLSLAPTTVSVQQGGTGTSTVTINRTNGFAGAVTLTATGLPNGVTAAFNPTAPTTNTSTLTLTAAANATVGGPTTVTVRGNATGIAEQTATLTVNVTAVTGGSGNVTYEFCTAANTPLWMAVQDGANGTWTRVMPTGTKFQFNVTQAKAGIAYVNGTTSGSVTTARLGYAERMSATMAQELLVRNRRVPSRANAYASSSLVDGFALTVIYGTQAELNSNGTSQCLTGAGKTVTGSVAGVSGPLQSGLISLGPTSATVPGSGSQNFTLTNVPDGALDLIASRQTTNIQTFATSVDKMIIRRALNQAANSVIPVLDFDAAEAFAPVEANITVNGLGTDQAMVSTAYFTAAGSRSTGASLFTGGLPGAGPFKYIGVPANKQIAGDLHIAQAIAFPNSQTVDQFRYSAIYFKDAIDRAVTLGPVLSAAAVSVAATTPYVRLRATGPIQTEYNKSVSILYTQSTTPRTVVITATAGYLSGLATYDFTIPDLSGAAGWDNNWGLKTGAVTQWSVSSFGYTGIGFGSSSPLEGSTFQGAVRTGSITP